MGLLDNVVKLNHITKRYEPQVLLKYQLPYRLTFHPTDVALPLAVPAAGQILRNFRIPTNTVQGTSPLGTPFEARNFLFAGDTTVTTAAAAFTVFLRLMFGKDYCNFPVHVRTIWGTAQQPLVLPEPIFLDSEQQLTARLESTSGVGESIRPYLDGVQYFPDIPEMDPAGFGRPIIARLYKFRERAKYIFPFFMTTTTPVTLGAALGATSTVEIKIDDLHFECVKIAAVSTGNFAFELSEVLSGDTLMNGRITQTNGIGNALYPTILPFSYLLQVGSRLRLTFENRTALANTIYLTLIGRKINAPLADIPAIKAATDDILPSADQPGPLVEEAVGVA